MVGPLIVLAALYLFWSYSWRNVLFYSGLTIMCVVAINNIIWNPTTFCIKKGADLKANNEKKQL